MRFNPSSVKWEAILCPRTKPLALGILAIILFLLLITMRFETNFPNGPSVEAVRHYFVNSQSESGWKMIAERSASFDVEYIPYKLRFLLWRHTVLMHPRGRLKPAERRSNIYEISKGANIIQIAAYSIDERVVLFVVFETPNSAKLTEEWTRFLSKEWPAAFVVVNHAIAPTAKPDTN